MENDNNETKVKKDYLRHKYSHEFYDIVDRIPSKYNSILIYSLGIIIVIALVFAWFTKSADIVSAEVNIVGNSYPIEIVTKSSGNIKFLGVSSNQYLEKGEQFAVVQNSTNYEDANNLKEKLASFNIDLFYPDSFFYEFLNKNLGELQPTAFEFIYSYYKYVLLQKSEKYKLEQTSLKRQINLYEKLNLYKQDLIKHNNNEIALSKEQLGSDSVLFENSDIIKDEYNNSKLKLYNELKEKSLYKIEILENKLKLENAIHKSEQLKIEKSEIEEQLKLELLSNYNRLLVAIWEWENKYVLESPISGTLEYLSFVEDGIFVQAGSPLFSIIPNDSKVIGRALLPSEGAGKVSVGQEVMIKLNSYPYQEYGYIEGTVASISLLPNNGMYLLKLELENGLTSNTGTSFNFSKEMSGYSEIITKKRRLIERMYEKLVYLFDKKNPIQTNMPEEIPNSEKN